MSGYFVHGGTQYPFNQRPPQQQQQQQQQQPTSTTQPFYRNPSYPTTQGQTSQQYSSYGASSGNNFASSAPSSFNSTQYNTTTAPSSSGFGRNSGSNYSNAGFNSSTSGFSSSSFNDTGTSTGYASTPSTQSSYEKNLYRATNAYYANKQSRGNSFSGRGRGGRGGTRGGFSQPQNTGPKPIKATEIKAYLYAWCGQRKLKPEYEVLTEGKLPKKVTFSCRLHINGLDFVANVEANNKKDAQSKAAWSYCENLVKMGYMKASELPPKPEDLTGSAGSESMNTEGSLPSETSESPTGKGGWNITNSRQRLNRFCQREQTTPVFKHTTLGPEHSRIFICDLNITAQSLKREFSASERGTNKKQATAKCALAMVCQLFEEGLIEKFGDPIKHVSVGGLMGGKASNPAEGVTVKTEATSSATTASPLIPGQKRKADDQSAPETVDENGNWTVDNSRQRLNQFCQVKNIPCVVVYEEEGAPGNRSYTATLNIKVKPDDADDEEKELSAVAKGQSKKVAAQGCAVQLLSQLYKLSIVEACPSPGQQPTKKKQTRQSLDSTGLGMPNYSDYSFMPFGSGQFMMGGFTAGFGRPPLMRRTPQQDAYLNGKHKSIYPTEHELASLQRSVRTVELALKEVSDELEEPEEPVVGGGTVEGDQKQKLQGVMRVGALAKGLLLKGDTNVKMVLLCREAPTVTLLAKVAQLLPTHIKSDEGNSFSVETKMQEAAVIATSVIPKTETTPAVTWVITIVLTSPVVRSIAEEAAKDPPGSLNKEKCLQALAELRHAKWFQACANGLPLCVINIRILRHMARTVTGWKALSDWTIELLAEKALATSPVPLSLGTAFLRCIEVIASGILLPGGPGICDPCERDHTDASAGMTDQERETVTTTAQLFQRLIIYRKSYQVLNMEPIDWTLPTRKSFDSATSNGADKAMES